MSPLREDLYLSGRCTQGDDASLRQRLNLRGCYPGCDALVLHGEKYFWLIDMQI
jgi:hypothetical protein